jgi:hypothetical protein
MNRRGSLKVLGFGATAAAVVAVAPEFCNSLCSSWCTEHAMPPAETIGGWADYSNFSNLAIRSAIDESVQESAVELGYRASLSISDICRGVFEEGATA